jgi:hypothetical protein
MRNSFVRVLFLSIKPAVMELVSGGYVITRGIIRFQLSSMFYLGDERGRSQ